MLAPLAAQSSDLHIWNRHAWGLFLEAQPSPFKLWGSGEDCNCFEITGCRSRPRASTLDLAGIRYVKALNSM